MDNERECLAVCAQHQGPVHLLVNDVEMPEIDGMELAAGAIQLRPDLKLLFVPPHPREGAFADMRLPGVFLQRPFEALGLVQKVCEALDQAN